MGKGKFGLPISHHDVRLEEPAFSKSRTASFMRRDVFLTGLTLLCNGFGYLERLAYTLKPQTVISVSS